MLLNFMYLRYILGIYDVKQVICPVHTKSGYEHIKIQFNIENVDLNLCTMLIILNEWHVGRGRFNFSISNDSYSI